MAATVSYQGVDYAMVTPDDPQLREFIGYRDEITGFVPGSNHGWQSVGSRGDILLFVRRTPSDGA